MSRELTTTQHLILTTIAWRGPCTPYELKDYFQRVVRQLVDVPHTLLYTEPPKLADRGLLSEEREETGRRRKTYTITELGRETVQHWVAAPPTREPSLEDEAIMKLIYSAFSTPGAVRELAEHQVAYYEGRIADLEAGLLSSDHDAKRRRFVRTGGRLALAQSKLILDFWRDVASDPDRKAEASRRGV